MAKTLARKIRRGMTLVELLVVVAILLILVSAATAMMQVAGSDKETREAARALNAMIAGCVARAAETGRPVGIWLERDATTPNMCREIFYAQSPPVYAGDNLTSYATITGTTTVDCYFAASFVGADGAVDLAAATDDPDDDFVRPGDTIRFNYSGPWYPIATIVDADSLTITIGDRPSPIATSNVPFQIRRGPRKSLANPLQMPADTVIDLGFSGADAAEFAGGTDAVRIMFNPTGNIDRVYFNGNVSPVLGALHLLIGRQAKVGLAAGSNNLSDLGARWISINHQTGTTITTETHPSGAATADVAAARTWAVEGKTMGGN